MFQIVITLQREEKKKFRHKRDYLLYLLFILDNGVFPFPYIVCSFRIEKFRIEIIL